MYKKAYCKMPAHDQVLLISQNLRILNFEFFWKRRWESILSLEEATIVLFTEGLLTA